MLKFLHRVARSFFEVDCVERVTQRHFARTSFRFQVSGFKFQVCGTKFTTSVHFRTGREVLHRVARIFLEKDYVEESYTEELHFDGNMDDADLMDLY